MGGGAGAFHAHRAAIVSHGGNIEKQNYTAGSGVLHIAHMTIALQVPCFDTLGYYTSVLVRLENPPGCMCARRTRSRCPASLAFLSVAFCAWAAVVASCSGSPRSPLHPRRSVCDAMPLKKGETHDDSAARLSKQSADLKVKAAFQRVVAALKANPEAVHEVERHLADIGKGSPATSRSKRAASDAVGSATKKLKALSAQAGSDSEEMVDEPQPCGVLALTDAPGDASAQDERAPDDAGHRVVPDPSLSKEFEKNQTCYMKLNVCDITTILSSLEPAALSDLNLRRVVKRGARLENATRLLELLEFVTNESAQSTISREHRQLGSLVRFLAVRNEKFGRRARDMTLPPCWDTHGVYMLQHFGEQVFVQHRFQEHIRARVYPPVAGGLFIEMNYSELRATLKQESTSYNQPIILLFPQAIGQGAVFTPKKGSCVGSSDGRSRSTTGSSSSPGAVNSGLVRKPSSRGSSASPAASLPMEATFAPPPPPSSASRRRFTRKTRGGGHSALEDSA